MVEIIYKLGFSNTCWKIDTSTSNDISSVGNVSKLILLLKSFIVALWLFGAMSHQNNSKSVEKRFLKVKVNMMYDVVSLQILSLLGICR